MEGGSNTLLYILVGIAFLGLFLLLAYFMSDAANTMIANTFGQVGEQLDSILERVSPDGIGNGL